MTELVILSQAIRLPNFIITADQLSCSSLVYLMLSTPGVNRLFSSCLASSTASVCARASNSNNYNDSKDLLRK